jgi:TolB-like protein
VSKDPDTHNGLGVAYLKRGLTELAIKSLLDAVTADPANRVYAANLALAYAAADKREEGMKHLFGALAKDPSDPVLQHLLKALSAPKGAAKGGGEPVAILPFGTAGSTVEHLGLADMLAAMFTTAMTDAGTTVVERARLDDVLGEQKLQATSHFDPKTSVRIGKLLGARKVVVGNAADFAGALAIDVRLIDVRSGKVLASTKADSKLDLDMLRKALGEAARKLN